MNNFLEETILKENLIQMGDHLLIALSGGADSISLCHCLWRLQEKLSLSLRAIHVHHGIRGKEADRDAEFCKKFCESLSIPLELYTCSVPTECAKTKESEETCARRLRYAAFLETATENEKIVTAHTASDNAETILFHLARGTGLKGLLGIPKTRGKMIRPMLSIERKDVEAYCKEQHLDFVTDSTNLQKEYARNRIRMEAIPALLAANAAAVENISRMTKILTEEEALLESLTDRAQQEAKTKDGLSCTILKTFPKILAMRVLQKTLKETFSMDVSYVHVKAVYDLNENGAEVSLPENHLVYRQQDVLHFLDTPQETKLWSYTVSLENFKEQTFEIPMGTLKIQKLPIKDLQNFYKQHFPNAIDCAKIGTVLELRSRKEGDSFTHPKRKVSKTLKKWQNELALPKFSRKAYPVLACQKEVLWAAPLGTSLPYLPNVNTKQILLLTIQNGGNTNND